MWPVDFAVICCCDLCVCVCDVCTISLPVCRKLNTQFQPKKKTWCQVISLGSIYRVFSSSYQQSWLDNRGPNIFPDASLSGRPGMCCHFLPFAQTIGSHPRNKVPSELLLATDLVNRRSGRHVTDPSNIPSEPVVVGVDSGNRWDAGEKVNIRF